MAFRFLSGSLAALLASSLWLPAVSAADPKTAADYYVHDLPGAPEGPLLKMHAGHIEVNPETAGHLFFWHFQNRHIGDKQRTVLWLNGGPGCSSLDGALMELGPYRVVADGKLAYNNGSWDEFANLLFVDQPVGTGFSYVETDRYLHELPEMADNMITFLDKFFQLFPQYEHDDIYLAGESYAGQYIPYLAQAILARNKNTSSRAWDLKGLLIGNGWISPEDQYPAYLQFAYKNGLVKKGSKEGDSLESLNTQCLSKLAESGGEHVDVDECEGILTQILSVTQNLHGSGNERCVNMYDIRLRDSYPSCGMNWPPDLEQVTPYLRRSDVTRALHVDQNKRTAWVECQGAVGSTFKAYKSSPSIKLLPDLLAQIPIVLFSGDKDLICSHIGTENLIHRMEWNGAKGFETSPGVWAPKQDWEFENEPAGYWQQARNLTYVLFYNSSHMVPFDYARRTRDMLDRFMGVDISSIGGYPQSSLIDGEKNVETSVGGHPNSTAAQEAEEAKLKDAEWRAYYRAGEVALVVVLIALGVWIYFVLRQRRRMSGYAGVTGRGDDDDDEGGLGAGVAGMLRQAPGYDTAFRKSRERVSHDLEAADFDISMSDLGREKRRQPASDQEHYDLADDSDDDDDDDDDDQTRAGGATQHLNGAKDR